MTDYRPTFASWNYTTGTRKTNGGTPNKDSNTSASGNGDGGKVISITGGSFNGVTLTIATVTTSDTVSKSKFDTLITEISKERVRRGHTTYSYTISKSNQINTDDVKSMIDNLNVSGPGSNIYYTGAGINQDFTGAADTNAPPSVGSMTQSTTQLGAPTLPGVPAKQTVIKADVINTLITGLVNAAAACTCNCNYCTCNCNYCTCNCNYSCTCNCNYGSDRRLKENIEFVGVESGLNLYTWNYIKDKTVRYIGVMAQELLGTKYENAVMIDSLGYYSVNYSKLPVEFKEV